MKEIDPELVFYRALLSKISSEVTCTDCLLQETAGNFCTRSSKCLQHLFFTTHTLVPPAPSFLTTEDFVTFYNGKIEKNLPDLYVYPEEIQQVILSCNSTTFPPSPSTMLQTVGIKIWK